jgi:hypothetical protein
MRGNISGLRRYSRSIRKCGRRRKCAKRDPIYSRRDSYTTLNLQPLRIATETKDQSLKKSSLLLAIVTAFSAFGVNATPALAGPPPTPQALFGIKAPRKRGAGRLRSACWRPPAGIGRHTGRCSERRWVQSMPPAVTLRASGMAGSTRMGDCGINASRPT